MVELTHTESVHVARPPEDVYQFVTDIGRTGEWSPVCTGCTWENGAGPVVGAWFVGRNESDGRSWETRSKVVAAEPGREFAWLVGGAYVRWGFVVEASGDGSSLTESWEFLPAGIAMFQEKYGDDAAARIELRAGEAHSGIPASLAAIKGILES